MTNTITQLISLQGSEPDARFAPRWLNMSGTSWYRLKTDTYSASPEKLLVKCEAGLRTLTDYREAQRERGQIGRTLELTHVETLYDAVKTAQAEPRDRLVVFLAPTGGGKTTAAHAILERHGGNAVIVEATECWRTSYLAATLAITKACGLADTRPSARAAETVLLDHLSTKNPILIVDESHYFGPTTINLIKAIINRTQTVVVLLAIPALWHRLKRAAWEEAEQIRSRTTDTIELRALPESEAAKLLLDRLPNLKDQLGEKWKVTLTQITAACNQFGLLDTLERICAGIKTEVETGPATAEIVTATITAVNRTRR